MRAKEFWARHAMNRRLQPAALGLTLTMLIVAQSNFRLVIGWLSRAQ